MRGYHNSIVKKIINYIVQIIVVIALAWFLVYSYGYSVENAGNSMQEALNNSDRVLINRLVYNFLSPKRYDLIAFKTRDGRICIRRVIALPKETIYISGGNIYINGDATVISDEYRYASTSGLALVPIELSEDEFFVLGDNRLLSEDSRFLSIGNVNKKDIIGKAWIRIHPIREINFIK